MSSVIKIGNLNCQNNSLNRNSSAHSASVLAHHIEEEAYDIFSTQELTRPFINSLNNYFKGHKLYGKYRYGNSFLARHIPMINKFNETNSIITNMKIIKTDTKRLPWFPNNFSDFIKLLKKSAIMPRTVTVAVLNSEEFGNVCAINTHLDYRVKNIQLRQLKYLHKTIKKYSKYYPIVLTGDFNMEVTTEHFSEFIESVSSIVKRVPVNLKTNGEKYRSKTAIDHIFIPVDWKIMNCGVIDNDELNELTDHKEIYVEALVK